MAATWLILREYGQEEHNTWVYTEEVAEHKLKEKEDSHLSGKDDKYEMQDILFTTADDKHEQEKEIHLTTADDKHEQEEEIHFTTADDKHEQEEEIHFTTADDKHEQEEEIHFTTAEYQHEEEKVCHVYKMSEDDRDSYLTDNKVDLPCKTPVTQHSNILAPNSSIDQSTIE